MSTPTRPIAKRTHLALAVVILSSFGWTGCTSTRGRATDSLVSSPTAAADVPMDEAVFTAREPLDAGVLPERRRVSITASDADIRGVLLTLAEQTGIDVVVDPDVSGRVTLDIEDVELEDALEAVVSPGGYHYRLSRGLLRVYGDDFQTRVFALDYITAARVGRTRLSASSGGTSAGEGSVSSGENLVSVDSVINADLWREIVAGLEMIVLGGTGSSETGSSADEPEAFESDDPLAALSDDGEDAATGEERGPPSRVRKRPRLVVHPHSGTILVTASFATLNRVADFLERIQGAAHRQVVIEARIVEVSLTDGYTLGIDWSRIPGMGDVTTVFGEDDVALSQTLAPGNGIFQVAFSEGDFDALLGALASQGDVKVISAPRVAALNNQKAVFKAAREQSFFSRRIDFDTQPDGTSEPILTVEPERVTIGLVLDVTPQISAGGDIMMSIHPSVTELTGEDIFPPGASGDQVLANAPILDIREVDTVVRVETGQLLVIGGLMKERVSEQKKMVPVLGKIPILGHLFSQTTYVREHVELVIALRPVVVVGREADRQAMRELERLERF